MANIINIEGTEITIDGFNVTFIDKKLGENVTYTLKKVNANVDENFISVEFGRKLITSNGFEIPLDGSERYKLDIDLINLVYETLTKTFINTLFKDGLRNQGIEAEQIYNDKGEIEVITKPITPIITLWVQPLGNNGLYPYLDPKTNKPYQVSHKESLWENTHTGGLNVWEPGVFGWKKI
jgi:hypothetical protein